MLLNASRGCPNDEISFKACLTCRTELANYVCKSMNLDTRLFPRQCRRPLRFGEEGMETPMEMQRSCVEHVSKPLWFFLVPKQYLLGPSGRLWITQGSR